jgi:hypothetical protein
VSDDIYVISLFVLMENKNKKTTFFFFAECNTRQRGLCRVPWHLHSAELANLSLCFPALPSVRAPALGKEFSKKIKIFFAERRSHSTRQRIFKKIKKDSLPSAG